MTLTCCKGALIRCMSRNEFLNLAKKQKFRDKFIVKCIEESRHIFLFILLAAHVKAL